jgi:hydrogenase-4 component H
MTLASKLRLLRVGLAAGRVTLPYPAAPRPAPPGFRGRPEFDVDRCIGCGGCASNCPARAILVRDLDQETRVLLYVGRRCAYCGRCAEVCPEQAITLSGAYELATDRPADLTQRFTLFMGTCQRCGRCFAPAPALAALKRRGFREDDLEAERWVPVARAAPPGAPGGNELPIEVEG